MTRIKEIISDIFSNKYLLLILVVALFVRLLGINHGFPIIFNIDEPALVRSVIGLRFSLNPNRFDWPATHFYLNFVFYMGFYFFRSFVQLASLRPFLENIFPILWQDDIIFYLISRVLNGIMGGLTVIPLYYSAKLLLKDKKLALLTSFLFAVIPFAVSDAHLALLDTALTFWITIALYYILRLLESPSYKNYILSGLFLGLSFGTKYNAIFYYLVVAIVVITYHFEQTRYSTTFKWYVSFVKKLFSINNLKKYSANVVAFFTAYLLTNPYVLFDFDKFWSNEYGRGFLFQFENVGNKTWIEYPASLYENLVTQSVGDYGLTLYVVLLIVVLLYLFFNYRNRVTNITLLLPLFLYLYVSKKDRNPSHYFLFLYPLLSILAIKFISDASNFISRYFKLTNSHLKTSIFVLLLLFTLYSPVKDSINISYKYAKSDTRQLAYFWLQDNLTKDDTLYYYGSELNQIPFHDINEEKLKRVDSSNVDDSKLPFYLMLGVPGVSYADLMSGDRDSELVDGNVSRFINDSELMYYIAPDNQFGPPVFIFKVNSIEPNR